MNGRKNVSARSSSKAMVIAVAAQVKIQRFALMSVFLVRVT